VLCVPGWLLTSDTCTDAPLAGSCPSTGIKYLPKTGTPASTTTTTGGGGSAPTGTSLPAKANIRALTASGASTGGLLTAGTWSTQTLASMALAGSASGFTMTSSKGACGVSGGALACGSGVSAGTFTAVSSGGSLLVAYGGSTAFTSDATPSGTTVATVYAGSARSVDYSLVIAAV
jgi:ribonuclease T2